MNIKQNKIINFQIENENEYVKYLFVDVERRLNKSNELEVCSIALSALDEKQKQLYSSTEFILKGSMNCPRFIQENRSHYGCFQSFILDTWEPRDFVSNLFNSLQYKRWKNNTQLIAFNLSHDQNILMQMFHEFGYPFFWDDQGFESGGGNEGPFGHDGIDLLQIGFQCRANHLKKSGKTRSRLTDTAYSLGLNVLDDQLHTARYDCYLAQQIFFKSQEALSFINSPKAA